jgi:hypothetical protein
VLLDQESIATRLGIPTVGGRVPNVNLRSMPRLKRPVVPTRPVTAPVRGIMLLIPERINLIIKTSRLQIFSSLP